MAPCSGATRRSRGTLLKSLCRIHQEKAAKVKAGEEASGWVAFGRPRFGSELFTVKHFAGEIVYDPSGFLSKNVDELHTDMCATRATA